MAKGYAIVSIMKTERLCCSDGPLTLKKALECPGSKETGVPISEFVPPLACRSTCKKSK